MAKPQAGSINRLEYTEKAPAMGKATANSPRAWTVQYNMMPISPYAMISEAGPPAARADPEPTNRPVPRSIVRHGDNHILVYTYR